jgi:hypothetical protein
MHVDAYRYNWVILHDFTTFCIGDDQNQLGIPILTNQDEMEG